MGNYLQNLRVPPATPAEREHERHHPLYYDWSQPKWSPFRTDFPAQTTSAADGKELADSSASAGKGGNLAAGSNATDRNTKQGNKTQPPATGSGRGGGGGLTSSANSGKLAVAAKSAIKTAKETIQRSLKSALTSTVDRADSKPVNADKTTTTKKPTSGGQANHARTTREAAHATSSMRKSSNGHLPTIKKVDSTRPQTIDPARNGGIDDQAALKAATNIHTVGSSSSSTRKRVPAS